MRLKPLNFVSLAFLCFLLAPFKSDAQISKLDQHIEVSLRMIGHQVLLSAGDSTSLVLPIVKDSGKYKISFDTEIEFNPEELVAIVTQVLKETNVAEAYNVEVEKCETNEIVYSFEFGIKEKQDIIPCKSRVPPKKCYSILLTLHNPKTALNIPTLESSQNSALKYLLIALAILFVLGAAIYWKKKRASSPDPNIIQLGMYQFDKRNTELILKQQRIELSSKEADLLLLLYDAVNSTVEREVILHKVWGDKGDYIGRTLDVFISKLRKKLEADSSIKIVNVRGVGYKLVLNG